MERNPSEMIEDMKARFQALKRWNTDECINYMSFFVMEGLFITLGDILQDSCVMTDKLQECCPENGASGLPQDLWRR